MAGPQTRIGDTLRIKVADVAGTTYAHYCMINLDRSISFTSNVQSQTVPDCDDPSLPDTITKEVLSNEFSISGAGVYDKGSADFFLDWKLGVGGSKRKVIIELGSAVGDPMITGAAGATEGVECLLSNLDVNGTHKENMTASMTIASAGTFKRTPKPV